MLSQWSYIFLALTIVMIWSTLGGIQGRPHDSMDQVMYGPAAVDCLSATLSSSLPCHLVHSGRYSRSPSWLPHPGDIWASSSGLLICHAEFIIALPPGPLWEVFKVALMTASSRWYMGQQQWTAYLPCRVHHCPAMTVNLVRVYWLSRGHPSAMLGQKFALLICFRKKNIWT